MQTNHVIQFRRLQESDFEKLYFWLQTPAVVKWWDNRPISFEAMVEKYRKRIEEGIIQTFVFLVDEMPIGMIQCYEEKRWDLYHLSSPAVGIDLFIGEEAYLHKGIGTIVLKEFIDSIVKKLYDVEYVCIDPDEDNYAAIKSYTKVGFLPVNVALCPDCGTHNTVFMVKKINERENTQ